MNKKAVIYTRVSSERQVDGYSLDSQEDLSKKQANQMGFEVEKIFREEGISGTTTNRPALQEMMAYCRDRKNGISAVFVFSLSRMNRNTENHLALRRLLAEKGVMLYSYSEPTGMSPAEEFVETIMAAKDQMENKLRAVNIANSLKRRFFLGHITSRPPIGYVFVKKNKKGTAQIDEELFKIVQETGYRIISEKLTTRQIATMWNNLGVRSKHSSRFKKFLPQSISKIYSNKFYAGILVSEKYGETKGKHKAMFTEDEFYQIRFVLASRRQNTQPKHIKLREDFPLRGILFCSECHSKLTGAWSKGRTKRYAYYACYSRLHTNNFFSRDKVEKDFIMLLQRLNFSEDYMQVFTALLREKYYGRTKLVRTSKTTATKELEELKEVRTAIGIKNAKGTYTDENYREMLDEINSQIAIKQGVIAEMKLTVVDIETILNFIKYYMTNFDKAWIASSVEGKQAIAGSMFPSGLTISKNKVRTATLARYYKLTKSLGQGVSLPVTRRPLSSNHL